MLPLLTIIAGITLACSLYAEPIVGRVVGVADGDTITVLDALKHQHKIRLSGIDAPEGGQAFGQRSKQALSDCAFGKQVTVDGNKLDRYGRTIGKVMVGSIDCNLRQVELGVAWLFKKYAPERPAVENKQYAAAEDTARASKRGLWADTHAMAPGNGVTVASRRMPSQRSRVGSVIVQPPKSVQANVVVTTVLPMPEKSGT